MEYTFLTENKFTSQCSCGYNLINFAESFNTPATKWLFNRAQKDRFSETYTAYFDSLNEHGSKQYELVVSCTIHTDHSFEYRLIRRTDNVAE